MSQIQNIITTTFRARGNQAISAMGQVAQGFGNIGRVINQNTRLSERLNAQWRAIGTTIRYAVAGSAVFGLTRMTTQLKDVQVQLGLIAAIGSQPGGGIGGAALSDNQVTQMGAALRNAAVDAIQPVNEMNDAAINFLSTVQNVQPSEIPAIITTIGRAATLAQTPVEDLTKAATTMNIAFGRANNRSTISQFSRQFFALTTLAPGGRQAGPEIANQLGPLSAMFALGRGNQSGARSQSQMMSLVLASLRFGGTPATSLRGLTFLTQSLIQPASPGARRALSGIGITPQSIQSEGVYANIIKFLQHISSPGRRNLRNIVNMSEDQVAQLDESGGNLPGIPANQMAFLRTALGRIHGVRAAVILAEQLRQRGDVQSLGQDLTIMQRAQADQVRGTLDMAKAWDRFRKRAKLQEASVALNAMSLQVAQIFEPVLNFAAGRLTGLSRAAAHHPTATRNAVIGGAAFAGLLGITRFARIGRASGQSLVMANAAQAALSGNTALGASPQNPLYVVMVSQLFGGGTSGPGGGGGGGGKRGFHVPGWLSGVGGFLAGNPALTSAVGSAGLVAGALLTRKYMERYVSDPLSGALGIPTTGIRWSPTGRPYRQGATNNYELSPAQVHRQILSQAQRMYGRGVQGVENYRVGQVNGRAEIYMTLDINQNGKVTRRRVHVPMDLWQGGRVPQNKANAGTNRGR